MKRVNEKPRHPWFEFVSFLAYAEYPLREFEILMGIDTSRWRRLGVPNWAWNMARVKAKRKHEKPTPLELG